MRKLNLILSYLSLLSVAIFRKPGLHPLFGNIARISLLIIVFSRPLADIFSHKKIGIYLRKIVSIRQGLGIICGIFALAHGLGYFLSIDLSLINIFSNGNLRNIQTMIGSGLRAMVFMLPPLITSHRFWILKLKKNRKNIQRFTYPAFVLTTIHIGIVKGELLSYIIILIFYSGIYYLAYKTKKGTKELKKI
ncbi:MAG TPA: hypothetical protein VJ892_04615 [Candidatus Absconditabacterales bacterium]|nr:hypothetical protein [Candidatus Absconditabacterales bacterium]